MKEKKLHITCPCERQKVFEKMVTISKNGSGVDSFETPCLICGDLLTIELPEKIANDSLLLRGLKKKD